VAASDAQLTSLRLPLLSRRVRFRFADGTNRIGLHPAPCSTYLRRRNDPMSDRKDQISLRSSRLRCLSRRLRADFQLSRDNLRSGARIASRPADLPQVATSAETLFGASELIGSPEFARSRVAEWRRRETSKSPPKSDRCSKERRGSGRGWTSGRGNACPNWSDRPRGSGARDKRRKKKERKKERKKRKIATY
jgi:hypothetical protein